MRRHSYNRHKIVTSCDLRPTPDAAGRLFSLSQPCAWNAFAPRLLVSDWFRLTHPPNGHPLSPSFALVYDFFPPLWKVSCLIRLHWYWVVLVLYSLLKGVTPLPTGVGAERAP